MILISLTLTTTQVRVTKGEAIFDGNSEVELVETMRANLVYDRVIMVLDRFGGPKVNQIISTNDVGG